MEEIKINADLELEVFKVVKGVQDAEFEHMNLSMEFVLKDKFYSPMYVKGNKLQKMAAVRGFLTKSLLDRTLMKKAAQDRKTNPDLVAYSHRTIVVTNFSEVSAENVDELLKKATAKPVKKGKKRVL